MSEKSKELDKVDKFLLGIFGVSGVALVVLLVISIINWNFSSVSIEVYVKNADIQQLNDYLYIEQGCSLDEAELTETFINALPSSLWEDFISSDGEIYILKEIPEDNVIGRTELKTNTIYIKDGYVLDALAHEFFHFYLSKNPVSDFTKIYKTESKALIEAYYGEGNDYYFSNETEYLCQLFQTVFVIGREDKLGVAPQSWSYMVNIIDGM